MSAPPKALLDVAAEIVDEVARGQAARMYRGGTWDDLTEHDKNAVRALVRPIVSDAFKAAAKARGPAECGGPR